jgi:alkaline phosphatase
MREQDDAVKQPGNAAGISRRQILKGAAVAAGAAGFTASAAVASAKSPWAMHARASAAPIKNIIMCVADGCSSGALAIAHEYLRLTQNRDSLWTKLSRTTGVRRALVATHSLDSVVTDSAAASATWSTGKKHRNGFLCVDENNTALTPIFIRAATQGRMTGAVTTTSITHATPAGFYANNPDRNNEKAIFQHLLERPVHVALGGGSRFIPEGAKPGTVARSKAELLAQAQQPFSPAGRLIGAFAPKHLAMALDRPDDQPTLAEMTKIALDRLTPASDGFFLQVEGGRVDHAGHANDACSVLAELLAFEEALELCWQFASGRNDTALIVTTDHATANPGLTFYGKPGIQGLRKLGEATQSFEWIMDQFEKADKPKDNFPQQAQILADLTSKATGVKLGTDAIDTIERRLSKNMVDPSIRRNEMVCVLGSIVGNTLGVQFVSPDHTADLVDLFAFGPMTEQLPTFMDNTELHPWLEKALGLPPV